MDATVRRTETVEFEDCPLCSQLGRNRYNYYAGIRERTADELMSDVYLLQRSRACDRGGRSEDTEKPGFCLQIGLHGGSFFQRCS